MLTRTTCRLALLLSLAVAPSAHAQTTVTGTLYGTIVDAAGLPVPGVTVTVSGPAAIRPSTTVTNESGAYRVIALAPGTYTLRAELQGFQTVLVEGVIVSVGAAREVSVTVQPAQVAESVTVVADTPVVDVQQNKNVQTITTAALETIPLARNIISAAQLAPGVVERTVLGSARNDTAYLIDGANQNHPVQGYVEANLIWDAIEEVEFITSSTPVETYGAIGGALNVVTKSGGNAFRGTAQLYYTDEGLAQSLLPAPFSSALNISRPSVPMFDWEASALVGGPIARDRIWFLGAYKKLEQEIRGAFRPTTLLGQAYANYNAPYTQTWYFGKVTAQLSPAMRFFTSYNYTVGDRPHDFSVPFNRTLEATRHWQQRQHTGSSNLAWTIGPKTFLDARAGIWRVTYDGLAQPGTEHQAAIVDLFNNYSFGRWQQPDATANSNYSGSVKIHRFIDDLGGPHEIKAGIDLQRGQGRLYPYSANSLRIDIYNDNIYYYRGLFGLTAPHPTFGDGRIVLSTASTEKRGSPSGGQTFRTGLFIQDTWRLTDRLTLNAGLRYDTTSGYIPESTKTPADDLAVAVGAAVLEPRFGINPYGSFSFPSWDVPLRWRGFSPQVGIVYGAGRRAIKAQWARYQERMPTWHFTGASPAGSRTFLFNWWDLNGSGRPDPPPVDRFEQANTASPLLSETWRESIDPDTKAPYLDEYTVGIDQELARNMRASVLFVYRTRENLASNPLYNLQTGTYWNTADSGHWVPFTTTVPGVGTEFAPQDVTVYYQKLDAPTEFRRLTNIPQATATYRAVSLSLARRMADGWQLGGSVHFSKNEGNYTIDGGSLYGQFADPNYFVNRPGREPFDRPVQVKLWGSATLPFELVGSFFYTFASGTPWARTVNVIPPAEWAAANRTRNTGVSVLLEPVGTRRNEASSELSARLEKVFSLPNRHRIGAFVEAFNVLGFTRINVQSNPAGVWRPVDVNSTQGTFSPGFTGPTSQDGIRVVKFSVRYGF